MGKKLYEESSVQAIADAIRAKAGTADTYKIAEMPDAIANLPSGGGATEPYVEEVYDSDGNLIEAKLYGYTRIRGYAFNGCGRLTSLSMPSVITSIEAYAFYGCRGLTSLSLPSGVTSIGNYAFSNCYEVAITSLPPGLTSIGGQAFYCCYKLAITRIPAGITKITGYTFFHCDSLTSLTFDGTPSTIDSNAFNSCTNLTTINVPWAEGAVANAPWGATNATINYNYTEG